MITAEANRQKQMMRLIQRYARLINEGLWCVPFIYIITFQDLDTGSDYEDEFICYTNNLVFACMIFEAQKLPVKILITGCMLQGVEPELKELINHSSLTINH